MATFLGCGSREAEAWLLSTLGDKGQALLKELQRINTDYGLELYVNIAVPVRIFTNDDAENVNHVMWEAAKDLDNASGQSSRNKARRATRGSEMIAKNLCLLALDKAAFKDGDGRQMSLNSYCKMLGWRRPQCRSFISESDIEQYDDEIGDFRTVAESRELIKQTYARIKAKI